LNVRTKWIEEVVPPISADGTDGTATGDDAAWEVELEVGHVTMKMSAGAWPYSDPREMAPRAEYRLVEVTILDEKQRIRDEYLPDGLATRYSSGRGNRRRTFGYLNWTEVQAVYDALAAQAPVGYHADVPGGGLDPSPVPHRELAKGFKDLEIPGSEGPRRAIAAGFKCPELDS